MTLPSEFVSVTQTFNVSRKRNAWDKFLDLITFRRRSVVQEIEVNFLFQSDVDPEQIDIVMSGLYLVESKCVRKSQEDF